MKRLVCQDLSWLHLTRKERMQSAMDHLLSALREWHLSDAYYLVD